MEWPERKRFAFTVFDDTDAATLANASPVYDHLHQLGLRTTKSVWMFDGERRDDNKRIIGSTCQDREYLRWVLKLQSQGFEIALHSATWSRSERGKVIEALDRFKSHFGDFPKALAQHNDTIAGESIYWGDKRVSGLQRILYRLAMLLKRGSRNDYQGERAGSPYFWGDICKDRVKYVRNFIYPGINTLKACPAMPYHDPERPYVNYWFASSESPEVRSFNALLSEENQERLEREGGACVVYTHFGKGFTVDGKLDPEFRRLTARLANRPGWFVPVSRLLDYLLERNGPAVISSAERAALERAWLRHKLRTGRS
ncbi:MAG: hypothetical protein HY077_18420 [Elusimicrobia bacterium]|nr:hypothetical protein [Elusimicrobiota bacterium]